MCDFNEITAAILAGGKGTRLRNIVSDRPKVLAEVNGRPFIAYLLDHLVCAGVRHTVLLTGYKGEMVEKTIGYRWGGMRISYSQEEIKLDTGGALRFALPHFETSLVLVLNGDSFSPVDLKTFVNYHKENGAAASIMLTYVEDTSRYGQVCQDDKGWITAFVEKGKHYGTGWINAGIYLFNQEIIGHIENDVAVSLEKDVFPKLIGKGLYGCRAKKRFIDIGIPSTYGQAAEFMKAMIPSLNHSI